MSPSSFGVEGGGLGHRPVSLAARRELERGGNDQGVRNLSFHAVSILHSFGSFGSFGSFSRSTFVVGGHDIARGTGAAIRPLSISTAQSATVSASSGRCVT